MDKAKQAKISFSVSLAYGTISGLSDWSTPMPCASPPSLLRPGSRLGHGRVKHTKHTLEAFPESLHWCSLESWADLQLSLSFMKRMDAMVSPGPFWSFPSVLMLIITDTYNYCTLPVFALLHLNDAYAF